MLGGDEWSAKCPENFTHRTRASYSVLVGWQAGCALASVDVEARENSLPLLEIKLSSARPYFIV